MPKEILDLLNEASENNKEYLFLLGHFYNNPSKSIGGSNESSIKDYYNYGDIKKLVLNPYFYRLLELCLKDQDFISKLDYNLLQKLHLLLVDISTFQRRSVLGLNKYEQELYEINFNDESLTKQDWIKELNPTKEDLLALDTIMLIDLTVTASLLKTYYYEKNIEPERERKFVLRTIEEDDYSGDCFNCFLATPPNALDIFKTIVCDNDFLKLVEDVILKQEVPDIILKNVIKILENGIAIKTFNTPDTWAKYDLRNEIGNDRIKVFDLTKTNELIAQLQKKLNGPRIRFVKS